MALLVGKGELQVKATDHLSIRCDGHRVTMLCGGCAREEVALSSEWLAAAISPHEAVQGPARSVRSRAGEGEPPMSWRCK